MDVSSSLPAVPPPITAFTRRLRVRVRLTSAAAKPPARSRALIPAVSSERLNQA